MNEVLDPITAGWEARGGQADMSSDSLFNKLLQMISKESQSLENVIYILKVSHVHTRLVPYILKAVF